MKVYLKKTTTEMVKDYLKKNNAISKDMAASMGIKPYYWYGVLNATLPASPKVRSQMQKIIKTELKFDDLYEER